MAILIVFGLALVAFMLVLGYLIDFRFDFRRSVPSELHGRRNFMRGCGPFEMGEGLVHLVTCHVQ